MKRWITLRRVRIAGQPCRKWVIRFEHLRLTTWQRGRESSATFGGDGLLFETRDSNADALVELKAALARGGVREAVAFLNALTPYRFTSLYRFDGPTLRNITFFDREHPELEKCEDIPVEASYCVFVRDFSERFAVEHAESDERVRNHPKRASIQFYCGVPLVNRDGKMFGTICHFDFKPGRIAALDLELLEHMARLLQDQ